MKKKIYLLMSLCLAIVLLTACTVNVNLNPDKATAEENTTVAEAEEKTAAEEKAEAEEKTSEEKAEAGEKAEAEEKTAEEKAEAEEETAANEKNDPKEETTAADTAEKTADQNEDAASQNEDVSENDDTAGADYEVSFERKHDSGVEYAVITAKDKSGKVAWTLATPKYDVAQLNQVENIGVNDGTYYYVESGTVKALNPADGSLLWENKDFGGSIADKAFAFGDDGNLYLAGYLGPDLFIVDKNGKTKKKIDTFSQDYYWPYEVEYLGDKLAITYEGTPDQQPTTLFIDIYSYTWTGETFGDFTDNQGDQDTDSNPGDQNMQAGLFPEDEDSKAWDTGIYPEVVYVSESSHLSEPEYGVDHTADSIADKDITTAWCEAAPGQGIGEWVEMEFNKVYPISGVTVYAGFQESEDLYYKNSRPASMTVVFSDGSTQQIFLNDEMKGQMFLFDSVVETDSLKFIIDSVYGGNKYEDTLITEIVAF